MIILKYVFYSTERTVDVGSLRFFIPSAFYMIDALVELNPCPAEKFYVLHSYQMFILLICSSPVVSVYFKYEWKRVWFLIRWLHQKQSDLVLQCFQINRLIQDLQTRVNTFNAQSSISDNNDIF